MGIKSTVVFTDLHGSTGAFGALGNARATVVITQILDQITALVYAHQGQLVKKLGDGVMAVFGQPSKALDFAVQVQRVHSRHLYNFELRVSLPVKIGIAFGDTEFTAGDYYGDAVNVAARLCDLAGPSQIWASKGRAVPKKGGIRTCRRQNCHPGAFGKLRSFTGRVERGRAV
jgi:class 3 adenylate cyclase